MRESRSIILRLRGGLGNELFQYAAMRALSLRLGLELKLDIHTGFARDPYHRKYMLGAFCIPVGIADTFATSATCASSGVITPIGRSAAALTAHSRKLLRLKGNKQKRAPEVCTWLP